ncbi:hypothetical protein [Acidihalobacter aeolianus]|uniref:hypothetical protein n=1 Tax=Acidihalobacter aeolianus TaxID=2792603 RepID=UPI0012EA38ED|nr:hypothetical protein [Acidihalobacter aeolianus]
MKNPKAKKAVIALAGSTLVGLAAGAAMPAYASMGCKPCAPKMSMSGSCASKNPCAAKKMGYPDLSVFCSPRFSYLQDLE